MMNGTSLTTGTIVGLGANGSSRIMGVETGVRNEMAEVGGLQKVIEGG